MRIERAMLLEQIASKMKENPDDSDDSNSPPPTVREPPHLVSPIVLRWQKKDEAKRERAKAVEERWLRMGYPPDVAAADAARPHSVSAYYRQLRQVA
jgi:hypothetical protein